MNRWNRPTAQKRQRVVLGAPNEDGVRRIDLAQVLGAGHEGWFVDLWPMGSWPWTRVPQFAEALKGLSPEEGLRVALRYFVPAWRVKVGGSWLPSPEDAPAVVDRIPMAVLRAILPFVVASMQEAGGPMVEPQGGA